MNSSKLFLLLLFFASIALCQINITGKVVDTLGNPIRGAQVALSVAGLKDTTDSTGQFVLASITTGNQINPYIKSLSGNPFIKNEMLIFYVIQPGTHVSADVFSVLGRLVAHLVNKSFLRGEFHIDMASLLPNSSKNAVYFVRLKIDNEALTLKWAILGTTNANTSGYSRASMNFLSKNTASITTLMADTIIVKRDGYYDEFKAISAYSTDVGLIKLFNGKMPTIQEEDTIKMAINGISTIVSKIDTTISTDSAMNQILHQCDTMKIIDSMWISGEFVCAKIKYGGICTWDFTNNFSDTSGISSLQKSQSNHSNSGLNKRSQIGQPACILVGGGDNVYNAMSTIKDVYNDLKIYYNVVDTIYKSKFTVDFITNELYKYDLVFLLTHGMSKNGYTYFLTGEAATIDQQNKCNYGEWKNGLVNFNVAAINLLWRIERGDFANADWLLMVSNKYITEKCDKQFKARLWYAAVCNQLTHPEEMGKALVIDRGVKEVVGWNCEVEESIGIYSGKYLLDSMLNECKTLSEVYSFLEIVQAQKYFCSNKVLKCDNPITDADMVCNLTTCSERNTLKITGNLKSYPDDINNSILKLRTDCVSLPQTPTLTSPVDGSTGLSLTPTITWSTITGVATYHVQVSMNNTFAIITIEDSTLTSPSKALSGLTNSTQYYWRVRAKNASDVSAWTGPWSFTTIIAAPQTPTLTLPVNGATGQSLTPNLTWSTVSGAATYHVQVSTVNTFATILIEDSTLTSATKAISGLINSTQYCWRVRAKNASGVSAWTIPWRFTTSDSTPTNGLVAYYPFNGNANDASSNGYNGSVNGAVLTSDRFGNLNSAYSFNGGYIKLDSCPLPSGLNTPNCFTISIWANTSYNGSNYQYIFDQVSSDPTYVYYNIAISLSNTNALSYDVFPPANGWLLSALSVPVNKWTHILIIRNGNNRAIYINGSLSSSDINAENYQTSGGYGNTPDYHIIQAYLGRVNSGNSGGNFSGMLDDIRIYNRVLSNSEILALYHECGWTGQ